jgi:hypothetical protein
MGAQRRLERVGILIVGPDMPHAGGQMATIGISRMSYPPSLLKNWKGKDCRMLTSSSACEYLKEILTLKVGRRAGGRRFFGEAYVAANTKHVTGYYGSFKWLTNPIFSSNQPFATGPTAVFKEQLRNALHQHFGKRQLENLQKRARARHQATGVRPVPPDLWLLDRHGGHRFIEVKLPGDRIRPQQVEGMKLISSSLRPKNPTSVEIIDLYPDSL